MTIQDVIAEMNRRVHFETCSGPKGGFCGDEIPDDVHRWCDYCLMAEAIDTLTALAGAEQQEQGRAAVLQTFEMNDRVALKEMCRLAELYRQEQERLRAELEKVTHERDLAWGDLGFTKNDLGTALYRAEAAEAALAKVLPYVKHSPTCYKWGNSMGTRLYGGLDCNCGLAAHLPVPSTPHEEE